MELLVRVEHRGDPTDPSTSKRGDVIVCKPDGWAWSVPERTNPQWRIICVPDLTEADATELLASEQPARPIEPFLKPEPDPTVHLMRRTAFLDLDALDATAEVAALGVSLQDDRATIDAAAASALPRVGGIDIDVEPIASGPVLARATVMGVKVSR